MTYVDLSDQPIDCRENALIATLNELVLRPYNLSTDAMLRASLVRLTQHDQILLLVLPHITSDGWSMVILAQELVALYDSLLHGHPCPFPDLQIQYADFAVWQCEWLQGEVLDRQLSYWSRTLAEVSALNLPTDRRRPTLPSCRNGAQSAKYPQHLTDQLTNLARTERATLFITLLAAFNALLYKYTGQNDIAVGCPIANRQYVELEGLIGFFANTLVFRNSLSGNPTFRDLMVRVREVALGAYEHQDVPFEKLVEVLQPDRDLSRSPLIQVTFQLRNYPSRLVQPLELAVEPFELHSGIAKFDLSLALSNETDGLKAEIEYNPDLFESATIARMLGHFQTLLKGIVTNQEQRISELPLLTESERLQLLVEWNDTKTDYPRNKCVHELFETQVEKTPDAIAVVFEDLQLSYRELNRRANQLAHYLRKLGVGPEVLVGICVERSIEMIVGMLGILKAGGVYVPLDPDYPKERLGFMLEDTQAGIIVTDSVSLGSLPSSSAQAICLDRDWQAVTKEPEVNPGNQTTADNLAYVMYTSGSTGQPKGVMIPHRGLVNYLSWATASYGVANGQGAPVHSSIGFDLSITSLFTPLLKGRRVVLLSEDHAVEALSSVLHRETDFGLIKITPAHLEVLGQELPPDYLAHCTRALIIGGEALTFEKLAVWSKYAPRTRLINEYGPTETVVGCCVYEVAPGTLPSGPVPIGKPIANTQVYILDRYLNPVPIGVPGELHVGGDGLAQGYLNRPELTAEKFIGNPFSSNGESRLYKTGDLARYLPDGNIDFLGRIDDQVKFRGYRIELGEIEAVLGQHDAIQQAVVVAREDQPGDRRLVAYAVASPGMSALASELRSYLQQKLPEYMVPAAFMFVESMPLTGNGKLDRKALPAPEQTRPDLNEEYTAPRTADEELLAGIWSEVLKVEKVGIYDNFFDLGGHSLLATQIVSRIRSTFSIEFPLRSLFEIPTVAELAAMIEQNQAKRASDPALAQMLSELEAMSDEEAQKIVAK
jgi:amino acid adenylation domain-containing protein